MRFRISGVQLAEGCRVGDLAVGGQEDGLGQDDSEDVVAVAGQRHLGPAIPGRDAQVAVVGLDENAGAADVDLVIAARALGAQR